VSPSRSLLGSSTALCALSLLVVSTLTSAQPAVAGELTAEVPEISAGGQANLDAQQFGRFAPGPEAQSGIVAPPRLDGFYGGATWSALNFIGNANQTGFYQIPPDPIGAAGTDRVIDVVNSSIESWSKTGALQWRTTIKNFFTGAGGAGTLNSLTFDPKIVYDHYAGRFVVVALEQTTAPQASRILIAVSKTGSPASATAADWWSWSINSSLVIAGFATWADYPGVEIDEDAVYITTNMFRFTNASAGQRLWIFHKGLVGGLYSGGPAVNTVHDYYAAVAGSVATTAMPALVFGAGGAGPGIGTYLVAYSGLSDGLNEFIEVIRVNDPVGAVSFTGPDFVPFGNIDTASGTLPRGPQLGSALLIDTGDRRAQDAVWRNNSLWVAACVNPPAGPDANQSTAHWFRIDTSAIVNSGSPVNLLAFADQGDVGANEVAAAAGTAYPSIAVNNAGEMKMDFALFAASIYGSAGLTGRLPGDAAGTTHPVTVWKAGVDSYVRTFTSGSTGRNRWGDYSGIAIDPTDDRVFWLFNQWADVRGNPTTVGTTTEDGQWANQWYQCSTAAPCVSLECPPGLIDAPRGQSITIPFCVTNCGPFTDTFTYHIFNSLGWCPPVDGTITLQPNQTYCFEVKCNVPPDATCDFVKQVIAVASTASGVSETCDVQLAVDCPTPTRIAEMGVDASEGGATIHWSLAEGSQYLGFHVFREVGTSGRIQLTQDMIAGGREFTYVDAFVSDQPVNYWIAEYAVDRSVTWHGPLVVEPASSSLPLAVAFSPARPNPFGATTTFAYTLPSSLPVHVAVFDASGRLVRRLVDAEQAAGSHSVAWDGSDDLGRRSAVGLYLVVLHAGDVVQKQKVLLSR
jgi:hypothetical protein